MGVHNTNSKYTKFKQLTYNKNNTPSKLPNNFDAGKHYKLFNY